MSEKFEYIDHLKERITGRAKNWLDHNRETLPAEFADIPDDKIIALIEEMATPILRKIEDDAIDASVSMVTSMIKFSGGI